MKWNESKNLELKSFRIFQSLGEEQSSMTALLVMIKWSKL